MKFNKGEDPLIHSGRSGYSLDKNGKIPNPFNMPEEWLSQIESFSTKNYGQLFRLFNEFYTLDELLYKIKVNDRKIKLEK